jgi:hypothetical protein
MVAIPPFRRDAQEMADIETASVIQVSWEYRLDFLNRLRGQAHFFLIHAL